MTLKKMAKECKKIWKYVLKTGEEKMETGWVNNCPACHYAESMAKIKGLEDAEFNLSSSCRYCPLLGLWGNAFKNSGERKPYTPCQDSLTSPYRIYYLEEKDGLIGRSDQRKVSAAMIIAYMEKKYHV